MKQVLFVVTFILAGSSASKLLLNSHTLHGSKDHIIVETETDSTKPISQMSPKEKIDAHVVHFTGAVMSDTFVLSHFSRAFGDDQYSDFLKPGKYSKGNACLPKSIASSLDGIAIPPKTKLIVYNQSNLTGTKLIDVTGPAIVNNNIWQSSEFYAVANTKIYSRGLQDMFPQDVRQWCGCDMSYLQDFSFEILEVH